MRLVRIAVVLAVGFAGYKLLAPAPPAPPAQSPAEKFVADTLASSRVVVFGKSYCGFTQKALRVLEKRLGPPPGGFASVSLDQRADGAAVQEVMGRLTGATSVPRVFIGGKFVGGGAILRSLSSLGRRDSRVLRALDFYAAARAMPASPAALVEEAAGA